MGKRSLYLIVGIVVLLVIGAGVATIVLKKTTSAATPKTIVVASSVVPASLDPAVAFDSGSVLFTDQIYNTLIGYGTTTYNGTTVGSLNPVPELATSWTLNANGSVLFNLRQNVTFSNGDKFNSTAVQFSLDRVITMKQGADFHVFKFLNESGIHVLGPYKILLVPSRPYPWFLNLFQLWVTSIVDPSYVNANGGVQAGKVNTYMSDHAMGTGPYELTSYGTSEIILTANPNYWGGKVNITRIVYEVVPSPATQQTLLQKGSVNVALNIPLDQMATLKGTTGIKVKSGPTSSEYYIGLDENVTPFNNLSVRKAVLYAVNTSEITQYSTFGYGIVLKSVIAPTIESYTPAFQNYTFNVTIAKKYLSQAPAAYRNGFSTSFYYISGDPVGSAIATILQQELKSINITLKLVPLTSNTFFTENGYGHFPMFFDGWVNLLATPDDGMYPLFNSGNIGIYGNYNFFNNSTVSYLLTKAGETLNAAQRDSMYVEAQNIIAANAVEVPLFNLENVIPMTSNVHNLYVYPTFDIFFSQVSMG